MSFNIKEIFSGVGKDLSKLYNGATAGVGMINSGFNLESLVTPENIAKLQTFLTPEMMADGLKKLAEFLTQLEAQQGKKFFSVLELNRVTNDTVNVDIWERTEAGAKHVMAVDITNLTPVLTILATMISTKNGSGTTNDTALISAGADTSAE